MVDHICTFIYIVLRNIISGFLSLEPQSDLTKERSHMYEDESTPWSPFDEVKNLEIKEGDNLP